jgi:hypothetical protein
MDQREREKAAMVVEDFPIWASGTWCDQWLLLLQVDKFGLRFQSALQADSLALERTEGFLVVQIIGVAVVCLENELAARLHDGASERLAVHPRGFGDRSVAWIIARVQRCVLLLFRLCVVPGTLLLLLREERRTSAKQKDYRRNRQKAAKVFLHDIS